MLTGSNQFVCYQIRSRDVLFSGQSERNLSAFACAGNFAFTIVVDDRTTDIVKATLAVSYITDSEPQVIPALVKALQ